MFESPAPDSSRQPHLGAEPTRGETAEPPVPGGGRDARPIRGSDVGGGMPNEGAVAKGGSGKGSMQASTRGKGSGRVSPPPAAKHSGSGRSEAGSSRGSPAGAGGPVRSERKSAGGSAPPAGP